MNPQEYFTLNNSQVKAAQPESTTAVGDNPIENKELLNLIQNTINKKTVVQKPFLLNSDKLRSVNGGIEAQNDLNQELPLGNRTVKQQSGESNMRSQRSLGHGSSFSKSLSVVSQLTSEQINRIKQSIDQEKESKAHMILIRDNSILKETPKDQLPLAFLTDDEVKEIMNRNDPGAAQYPNNNEDSQDDAQPQQEQQTYLRSHELQQIL